MKKLLIANRGEIACRVIATARRMGLATVAVYSDPDKDARHVAMADEAVCIGPAPAAQSYLEGDRIIDAARRTGADAIHPGYGFLSENPDFADAVVASNIVFVGPPAVSIRAMGLKDAAKTLMQKAGVPVVPGYHGLDQSPERLAEEAAKVGYPVLIKARAGGGGKGMRRVEAAADFAAQLQGAMREGQANFGDPAVLIEKYIERPRHIEIQILADSHGQIVHLFERDCSLQRRHQKVIEEAPAPGMSPDLRDAMGAAAVEAARSVGYVGAGTVEFIVDATDGLRLDRFWFMEMNTRLQVEHPVTEAITGLDLVEWQLRVAMGERLPFTQPDLTPRGHAIEARLYAEDVAKGFLPATGRLDALTFPEAAEFGPGPLRIDSGVVEGGQITPWYDPMIAKVIAQGPTRAAALARLTQGLIACDVAGVVTNLDFLIALTRDPDLAKGQVDTGLIGRKIDALTAPPATTDDVLALAAIDVGVGLGPRTGADPWDALGPWRLWGAADLLVDFLIFSDPCSVRLEVLGQGHFVVWLADRSFDVVVTSAADGTVGVQRDGHVTRYLVRHKGDQILICGPDGRYAVRRPDRQAAPVVAGAGAAQIVSPMPGLIKSVLTQPGATICKGDALMIVEAMKMEYVVTAGRDAVVREIRAEVGQAVTDGAVLILLDPGDD